MPPRKAFFTPKVGLIIMSMLVVLLIVVTPLISNIPVNPQYDPESHALFEYFAAYIAICLLFICWRRFYLQRTKEFLFWGLGSFSFVILQTFQNFAYPGFHDFNFLLTSVNIGAAFDVTARILFSGYLLVGIININRRLIQPSFRNILLIYSNALALALFLAVVHFNFLPGVLFIEDHPTLLKKGLDILAAFLTFTAAFLFFRRFSRDGETLYFWFALACVFGGFTSIYLGLYDSLFDIYFDIGHIFKILFLSTFLLGIFADQIRFFKIEAELRESLEKSKEELEKSEKTFRGLVENMADGFVVTDKWGILIFCNQAFAEMIEQKAGNLMGQHFSTFFHDNSLEAINLWSLEQDGKQSQKLEVELLTKSGDKKPAFVNAVKITESDGEFAGIQAVITNLTERKKIEKHLESLVKEKTKNITIFKQCIENSTNGILIINLKGSITYLNGAFEAMTGYSTKDLLEKKTSVFVSDRASDNVHQQIWKSLKQGKIWRGEFHTKKRDGSRFIGDVAAVPIKDDRGRTINYLWMEKDITRAKTLEQSLQKYAEELTEKTSELASAKSYYETLISGMSDILLVVDNDGQCTFINNYGKKRLGFSAQELTKENLPIFFDDLKRLEKDYGSSLRMEIKDFEALINPKKGDPILCSWHARPLIDRYKRRIGAMAVGRDITEYKKMQNELQEYTKNLESNVKERTKELQQKVNQLGKLLEVGEEIRLNVDIDVILNKVCDAVHALGWNKVVISLRNHETRTSRVVATSGLKPSEIEEVMSWGDIPFEQTDKYIKEEFRMSNSYYVGHERGIIHKGAPFSVFTELEQRSKDEWQSLDALIVPIRTIDNIMGIISVDDPIDKKRPSLDKIRDLEIFADKAALAIENARLFQVQKEKEKQAKFLAEIGRIFHSSLQMSEVLEAIVGKGGKAIGEFCSLLLLDDSSEYLKPQANYHEKQKIVDLYLKGCDAFPAKIGQSMIGDVVSTGKRLLVSRPFAESVSEFQSTLFYYINREFPISTLMFVPLQVQDRIIGVMVYLSCKSKQKYKSEDLSLAQELADRAALAIDNAKLFNEAREKAHELEKANRLKTEFLANVSHELRTPLNAIITLSDILIRGISGKLSDEQIKQLQIIQRSGRNLLNLINDILDLSKIEAGKVEPVFSDVPIRSIVEETIEHIRPLCTEKGLALEFKCSDDVPDIIFSDQDKITKAVTNVLSNAVKFTPKGHVELSMSKVEEAYIKIEICDTGIGIPKDKIDEIFKEFQQVDSKDSRSYGGTGLGLAITRKVLNIIGGSVKVSSELHKGSVFTLLIPIKAKHDLTGQQLADINKKLLENVPEDMGLDMTDDRDQLQPAKKLILVIDDEVDAIYIMRQYLHEHNYQVIFPQQGESVFELAKKYQPYAITLDLLMPDQSGWDVLEILKNHPETQEIPVIISSILSEKEKALNRGATGYLVKPLEPEMLLALLSGLEPGRKRRKTIVDLPKILNLNKLRQKKLFSFRNKNINAGNGSIRILLVDDDNDTKYALQYVLEGAGYEVHLASEGNEALKQAKTIKPELILMDIMMPGMDGYEATKRLKSKSEFKNVPIIAMTAKAMKGDREEIILAGCDDYIAKPFMTREILALVEKWLGKTEFEPAE
ncbi:MAG: PAS domain S-box protein [bacterium]